MDPITYTTDGHVAVLSMNCGENRFNFPFFSAVNEVLDEIENRPEIKVLVTTSSDKKIWCNGIDLDWLMPAIEKEGQAVAEQFYRGMYSFLRRMLTYPMITIAAVSGHAFAGGAFLAFVHDIRFMRTERGWICLPEVDLKMRLGKGLTAIAQKTLPQDLLEEMILTGRRITAEEAQAYRVVKKACHVDHLMDEALAYAKTLEKDRDVIRDMKRETHEALIGVLDAQIAEFS